MISSRDITLHSSLYGFFWVRINWTAYITLKDNNLTRRSNHHHHLWQNSLFWAIDFLRRFCHVVSSFHFFGLHESTFFTTLHPMRSLYSYVRPTVTGWASCGFPFRCFLRLAGLRWRYSNTPPRVVCWSTITLNPETHFYILTLLL
jgi:hypothetical protein